ncbi:MAG: hypothetical protein NT040_03150 [Bacteroidetes bacterium]|nr:hypothetical protein [Bacteroidota bacterium]
MKHIKWKQLFNWGGFVIGIAGVVFVVRKLSMYSNQIDFSGLTWLSLCSLTGLIAAYGLANIFQAMAWHDILQYMGVTTTKKWSIQTYGVAQIAKYVPGNIFQFAGRQAIGQAAGLPAIPLAKSAVWEIGMLAGTGALFSVLVIPLFRHQVTFLLACIMFIVILVIGMFALYRFAGAGMASAMQWDILFLLLAGIVFYGVLIQFTSVRPGTGSMFVGIIGVYVVAWLAGLVTPGAPAGIGVREMVFLAILHNFLSEGELLKAILLGRFVTVGGDMLFYIFAMALRFRNNMLPKTSGIDESQSGNN